MKRTIFSIIIAAAALVGCQKDDDMAVNQPQEIVKFNIEAVAPTTRTALVETAGQYSATWKAGDIFKVAQVVNGSSRSYYEGTIAADTPKLDATVEFVAAEGSEFKYVLASPAMSMNGACTYMAFTLPDAQTPAAMNTFDGAADFLVSKAIVRTTQPSATETLAFEIGRLSAIGKVTIKNVPMVAGDKVVSVTFTSAASIAGKITNVMVEDVTAGIYPLPFKFSDGKNSVKVTLPEPQTGNFTYYMSCWPATITAGSQYVVTVTTEQGEYVKTATIPADLVFSAGDITSFTVDMAATAVEPEPEPEPEPAGPAYITVAGIKWAAGNLQYVKDGAAVDGYQAGWRIAPSQAHYIHCEVQTSGNKTDITSYDAVDHFNFGGITDPFSPLVSAPVESAAGVDLAAKMFVDQVCTTTTTDFAAAKYGDVAYWATNGKYRMPTQDEFKTLTEKASSKVATYTIGVSTIKGVFFYDPAAGATPEHNTTDTFVLTDEDLANGLFLPYAGRGYNAENTQYGIYNVGSQGVYRASTTLTPESDATQPCYGAVFAVQNVGGTKKSYDYWNKAFDAKGRYSIRPVFVE